MKDEIAELIPRLRRYARALAGRGGDDLVQDTLERAWSRRHLFREGSDLRAWMFTIMHNLFISERRRDARLPLVSEAALDGEPAAEAQPEGAAALRDLERALGQLAPEQREVILLVGLEQLRYEEAAAVLGVPVGTVMSRLARGRERLRALMGERPTPVLRRVK